MVPAYFASLLRLFFFCLSLCLWLKRKVVPPLPSHSSFLTQKGEKTFFIEQKTSGAEKGGERGRSQSSVELACSFVFFSPPSKNPFEERHRNSTSCQKAPTPKGRLWRRRREDADVAPTKEAPQKRHVSQAVSSLSPLPLPQPLPDSSSPLPPPATLTSRSH